MDKINKFNEEYLHSLSVQKLREMAKFLGIASPESKTKECLISVLLDVVYGRVKFNFGQSSKRNKTKDTLINRDFTLPSQYSLAEYVASPGQKYQVDYEAGAQKGVLVEENGIYYIRKYKFIHSPSDVVVSNLLVKNLDLKVNDIVLYTSLGSKIEIIKKLGEDLQEKPVKLPNSRELLQGKRNLVFVGNVEDKQVLLGNLASLDVVILIPSNSVCNYGGKNVLCMPFSYATEQDLIAGFLSCCQMAQFYSNMGQRVAVVCDNFLQVLSAATGYNKKICSAREREILSCIEQLSAAKISFIATVPAIVKRLAVNLTDVFDSVQDYTDLPF